jgi:hypothetical protein
MMIKNLINDYNRPVSNRDITLFSTYFFFYAFSVGINVITFSIFLRNNDINIHALITMISIQFIGGLAAAPFGQYICFKFRVIYAIFFGSIIRAIGILIIGVSANNFLWHTGFFLCGVGSSIIFTCLGYAIPSLYTQKYKNYDISIVVSIFALGFCFGNILIDLSDIDINNLLFVISAIISILSIFILAMVKDIYIHIKIKQINIEKIIKKSYFSILTITYVSYVFISIIYFIDIYNTSKYLDHNELIILYIMLGILFLTLPITYLYNKLQNNNLALYCTIFASIIIFCIPLSVLYYSELLIFSTYFLLGGLLSGILIVNLNNLKSIMFNQSLIHITSIIVILYNLGSFAGLIISNNLITLMGQDGFIYSIFFLTFVYLCFIQVSSLIKK